MSSVSVEDRSKNPATLHDYIRIARFDHMTKHVFIVPGIVLALLLRGYPENTGIGPLFWMMLVGFVAAVFVASANYVINEWLDRDFDRFHPEKSQRAAVQREMSGQIVLLEWAVLLILGLGLATTGQHHLLLGRLAAGDLGGHLQRSCPCARRTGSIWTCCRNRSTIRCGC